MIELMYHPHLLKPTRKTRTQTEIEVTGAKPFHTPDNEMGTTKKEKTEQLDIWST